jgi:hypothetical protein
MLLRLTAWCAAAFLTLAVLPARAETPYGHAYRLCMTNAATHANGDLKYYWRTARKACAVFARHPNPAQLAEFENAYDNGGSSGAANAAAAFVGGFISGYLGGGVPAFHGRTVSPIRGRSVVVSRPRFRAAPIRARTTTPYTMRRATTHTVSHANTTTHTHLNSTASHTTVSNSSSGSIGYITQPNGVKDRIYAKPPCATTQKVGPTSYICTNH